jgi:hypothetical protein
MVNAMGWLGLLLFLLLILILFPVGCSRRVGVRVRVREEKTTAARVEL